MPNILCISFPVEPSEIDLAKTLVGCTSDNKDMYISYWFDEDTYEWQMENDVGSLFEKELVLTSIHQIDQAKLLITLGLTLDEIKEILND